MAMLTGLSVKLRMTIPNLPKIFTIKENRCLNVGNLTSNFLNDFGKFLLGPRSTTKAFKEQFSKRH